MTKNKRISLWAAYLQIGGYPKLLLSLAQQHGLEVYVIGRARYLKRDDLERLSRHVGDWLDRPRMAGRSLSETQARHVGRPAKKSNSVSMRSPRGKPPT